MCIWKAISKVGAATHQKHVSNGYCAEWARWLHRWSALSESQKMNNISSPTHTYSLFLTLTPPLEKKAEYPWLDLHWVHLAFLFHLLQWMPTWPGGQEVVRFLFRMPAMYWQVPGGSTAPIEETFLILRLWLQAALTQRTSQPLN